MNKLEKVALRYTLKMGRPIVLVFNSMYLRRSPLETSYWLSSFFVDVDLHLLPNNEEGHAMIHQLQQRAEAWAEAVCATAISYTILT